MSVQFLVTVNLPLVHIDRIARSVTAVGGVSNAAIPDWPPADLPPRATAVRGSWKTVDDRLRLIWN